MEERPLIAEVLAELIGTMILIVFGCGVNAMVTLFSGSVPGVANGGYTNITLGWGLAVMFGVYASYRISGAHLNPAVTLALALFRGFPWIKVAPYILAQIVGAFVGAALVFWNYRPAFERFDPALEHTANIFATFPAFPQQPAAGFFDQVLGTALLLFCIFAIIDERNLPPGSNLTPPLIGLSVVMIGMSFGSLHGYAINPARDLGPRLLTVAAGFRNNGLTDGSNIYLVPLLAPLAGGVLGAALYDMVLRRWLPRT